MIQNLINSLGQFIFVLAIVWIYCCKSKKARKILRLSKKVNRVGQKGFRRVKRLEVKINRPIKSQPHASSKLPINSNVIQITAYRKHS